MSCHHKLSLSLVLGLSIFVSACASSTSTGEGGAGSVTPLIIKIKAAESENEARAALPALAIACEVQLVYLRPMSGGAHVVQLRAPAPALALDCLRAQPDVVYVQEDRLARPMTGAQ